MNETIRAKMVLHENNWINYLTKEERELVIRIWKAENRTLDLLKKEYPDLCFILGLWKIISKYDSDYISPEKEE